MKIKWYSVISYYCQYCFLHGIIQYFFSFFNLNVHKYSSKNSEVCIAWPRLSNSKAKGNLPLKSSRSLDHFCYELLKNSRPTLGILKKMTTQHYFSLNKNFVPQNKNFNSNNLTHKIIIDLKRKDIEKRVHSL